MTPPATAGAAAAGQPATVGIDDALLTDLVPPILARLGADDWQITPAEFWCHVEPPGQRRLRQGWKLHISATPLSAALVLSRVTAVLVAHRTPFKFAGTLRGAAELVSRHFDRSGGGKFVTAYPEGDLEQLRALAAELHRVTVGLPGPSILSDRAYRPGSLVHYRYGAFRGAPALSNDGVYEVLLTAPDGSPARDERRAWFTPPPWVPTDPFTGQPARPPSYGAAASGGKPVLLDGRYLVREVIRHSYTGGVYRATDQRTGAAVILKQGRPHTGADPRGADVRDARRHEARMLQRFDAEPRVPALVGLFEQQGEVFSVQEAIAGSTLRRWVPAQVSPADNERWGLPEAEAVRLATELVGLVELVHRAGLVLRDLNPNNVMVTDGGELRLIDLEALAEPGEQVVRTYTPGYGAPEQVEAAHIGAAPAPTADLYALGATLFFLATGADPVLPPEQPQTRPLRDRLADWLAAMSVGNAAARRLTPLVLALLDPDPQRRPDPDRLRRMLREGRTPGTPTPAAAGRGDTTSPPDLDRLIADAVEELTVSRRPLAGDRLWAPDAHAAQTDPHNVQHGNAGVLAALTRALVADPTPQLRRTVTEVAQHIRGRLWREPRILPGLYLGRSGTAWALLDAAVALADPELAAEAADLARRVPLHWPNPDVYHGVAGAGLTQLHVWEVTGDPDFLDRAATAADLLATAAEHRDGQVRWPVPGGFASALAGSRDLGFAHGVAGVGTFLLAVGRATGEQAHLDLAMSAARTLAATVQDDRGAAFWPADGRSSPMTAHLCNGSSGIATFLAGAWRHSGADDLGAVVASAARAPLRMRWSASPAQCHGLAGDGEVLLDLAGLPGLAHCRDWAAALAASLHPRLARRDGRLLAADETGQGFGVGFGTGLSGVLAFLLRLRHGGPRSWLPQAYTGLLTGAAPTAPGSPAEPGDPAVTGARPLTSVRA